MTYDLKITGGTIIDGTGAVGFTGDVGIRDRKIVALGRAPDTATQTLDADGAVVAPGFVDIHTHYDAQILWDPLLSVSPWHGVTTAVLGNCGFGVAPTRPEFRRNILRTLEGVEGMSLAALEAGIGPDWDFVTFPDYLDAIDGLGVAINVAVLAGHTPIRFFVMGDDAIERSATDAEIVAMQTLVVEAIAAGALGFSTSITTAHLGYDGKPVPSRLAAIAEIQALAKAVGTAGGSVFHMVSDGPEWDLREMLARESGAAIHGALILAGADPEQYRTDIHRARQELEAGNRIYPMTACRPVVFEIDFRAPVVFNDSELFLPILTATSDEAKLAIYRTEAFGRRLREDVAGHGGTDGYFSGTHRLAKTRRITFAMTEIAWYPPDPSLEGRRLVEVANERSLDHVDVLIDMILASKLAARFRIPRGNFDETGCSEILREDVVVLGLGDGGAHMSQLCDAAYPTDLLGRWVREKQVLRLERAVHMLTGRPAALFGLSDRGLLARGRPADIVVFDPATVGAGPLERIFDLPAGADRLISRPRGIQAVLVNGTVLPPAGAPFPRARALPGKLLRHGRA